MKRVYRIGFGVDSHRFEAVSTGKKLMLGGIEIPHPVGMESHSDGDVILHALYNALASALGEGSIGTAFPDSKEENQGRDSKEFVAHILQKTRQEGYIIQNVGVSLECKTPKINPHEKAFKESIAQLLGIKVEQVAVHATTGESLTAVGKGKGIYTQVIVLLEKHQKR